MASPNPVAHNACKSPNDLYRSNLSQVYEEQTTLAPLDDTLRNFVDEQTHALLHAQDERGRKDQQFQKRLAHDEIDQEEDTFRELPQDQQTTLNFMRPAVPPNAFAAMANSKDTSLMFAGGGYSFDGGAAFVYGIDTTSKVLTKKRERQRRELEKQKRLTSEQRVRRMQYQRKFDSTVVKHLSCNYNLIARQLNNHNLQTKKEERLKFMANSKGLRGGTAGSMRSRTSSVRERNIGFGYGPNQSQDLWDESRIESDMVRCWTGGASLF